MFRSRLEARWAVFFDSLKIEWEYEPEGYDLDGVWYLPDFRLAKLGFAEVKPKGGDFSKARLFVEKTQQGIWLCEGVPEAKVYTVLGFEDGKLWESCATPNWDVRKHGGGFFWEPGYEERNGTYSDEYCSYNPEYMAAVYAAKNYNFKTYKP